ncbi:MAG TPA: cell division protein ZapA [Bacteroidales bacterium]|nr:MAG: cell division protein ZapA [Bacteroidetes bacterium GWF2_33_38]OFY75921.1 MAG: cell division protein ZapA [Bacteroidetes bacterium RIFOXYA12_FULL_33_9]OFY91409.1 MAG: cell division protein ZapA [Bacteroidetes bacterium RIFOXYA2_FULL_33_7]HBF87989.1 cell division protein ZapA [Bacteroidales bacterium]
MEDEKLTINLNIVDRFYPLRIDRKEEENIRKAAKLINDRVFQYKQRYADKDTQDFLSMAALQFVIKMNEFESKADVSPILDQVDKLNSDLEDYLEKE